MTAIIATRLIICIFFLCLAVCIFASFNIYVHICQLCEGIVINKEKQVCRRPQNKHGILAKHLHALQHIHRGEDILKSQKEYDYRHIEHCKLYCPHQQAVFLLVEIIFKYWIIPHEQYEKQGRFVIWGHENAQQAHCAIGGYRPVFIHLHYHHNHHEAGEGRDSIIEHGQKAA